MAILRVLVVRGKCGHVDNYNKALEGFVDFALITRKFKTYILFKVRIFLPYYKTFNTQVFFKRTCNVNTDEVLLFGKTCKTTYSCTRLADGDVLMFLVVCIADIRITSAESQSKESDRFTEK